MDPVNRRSRTAKAAFIVETLDDLIGDVPIPLRHQDPFTLLVAVILSGQSTDAKVNQITPELFSRAATPTTMAALPVAAIEDIIRPCGLAPSKARNISETSRILLERHAGQVPRTQEELESLPGVGPKTAQVVLAQAFRSGRLPGGHPHPPPGVPLGAFPGPRRRAHRARPEAHLPATAVEPPAPADHHLRPHLLPGSPPPARRLPDLQRGGPQRPQTLLTAPTRPHRSGPLHN